MVQATHSKGAAEKVAAVTKHADDVIQDSRRSPPLVLYHYTTLEGFRGMAETRELWATDMRFLNDAREFRFTLDTAKESLLSLLRHTTDEVLRSDIAALVDAVASTSSLPCTSSRL